MHRRGFVAAQRTPRLGGAGRGADQFVTLQTTKPTPILAIPAPPAPRSATRPQYAGGGFRVTDTSRPFSNHASPHRYVCGTGSIRKSYRPLPNRSGVNAQYGTF